MSRLASPLAPEPGRGLSFSDELRVLWGFFYRRMAEFFSNRANTILDLTDMLMRALSYGILGMFVTSATGPQTRAELQGCTDYTAFLIIGLMVHLLVWSAKGNMSWLVRSQEFPNLYMAPCRLATIILGANMWKYVWIFFQVAFFLVAATLIFKLKLHFNLGFVVVVLGGMVLMTGFDMLGAAFRIITKSEEDPFNYTLSTTSTLLSGQLFPVTVLPRWAQILARFHPVYYINVFARRTMGGGESIAACYQELLLFAVASTLFMLLSYQFFKVGFHRARVEGTLGHR